MISTLGSVIARVFRRTCPDPFVIAILLTLLTAVLVRLLVDGITFGEVVDGWGGSNGLWKFLPFSMQMCLVLVTGHALASSRVVSRGIRGVAGLPGSAWSAVAMTATVAAIAAVINWGLGLIVGALLARDVARAMHAKGIRVHYPLLAAAGYVGLLVWHGGMSGSAPLKVVSEKDLAEVLSPELAAAVGQMPLNMTVGSMMNVVITGGLIVLCPIVFAMLCPKNDDEIQTIEEFDVPESVDVLEDSNEARTIPDMLERSHFVTLILVGMIGFALVRILRTKSGISGIGLNEVNLIMLMSGLIAHGTPTRYVAAINDAARSCGGIILQFPLYAGIMGMMSVAPPGSESGGLAHQIADQMAQTSSETMLPIFTFVSAGLVNLFVPSGGGQWGIQGEIAMSAAQSAGVEYPKMVMAVAYGDQLTNMLQPFWALPLLGITGVKARDIVGYTAMVMIVAAVWIVIGLVIF